MIDNVIYRRLLPQDYSSILRVWQEAGLPFRPKGRDSQKAYIRQLKDKHIIYLGAFSQDEMVGVIIGSHDSRKGWINRLAVVPRMQNRGIAQELVASVERYFIDEGINIFAALVDEENTASLSFFDKNGYELKSDIKYLRKFAEKDF